MGSSRLYRRLTLASLMWVSGLGSGPMKSLQGSGTARRFAGNRKCGGKYLNGVFRISA